MGTRERQEAIRSQLRRLNNTVFYLNNPERLLIRVNKKLIEEGWIDEMIAERFDSQGSSQGNPWAPLKVDTIRDRARKGFGPSPILVRTGSLLDKALSSTKKALAEGIEVKMRGDTTVADALNDGTFTIPARPFFGAPTAAEIEPLVRRRNQLINEALRRLANGESLTGFLPS